MAAHLSLTHLLYQQQTANRNFQKEYTHSKSFTPYPVVIDPRIKADSSAEPITPLLYAGFLEHLGRCIYGGIVDNPKDPSPAKLLEKQPEGEAGWRTDVKELLAAEGELAVQMMRWPGGNFVSNYHWQDGIGPVAERPKRIELAWMSTESNQFGTDEFIRMCRAYKWEPYICLNMGTGTYEEALAWLEYCNGTGDTHWANLRRKNTGTDEPYGVKYWGLGNESEYQSARQWLEYLADTVWGPWQVGNIDAREYALKAKQWAHGLKLVDPTIKLISCGETGWADWDREVLSHIVPYVDMHALHFYTTLFQEFYTAPGNDYEKNVFGPTAPEIGVQITKNLIDLVNVDNSLRGVPAKQVTIAYDEWNVFSMQKASMFEGHEQIYDYTDMLGTVAWLNMLVRQSKHIGLACIAQSCNVIAPIITKPDGVLKQCTFYPLKLFSTLMRDGHLLQVPSLPDYYTGPTWPTFIQQIGANPRYIDLVAMASPDGTGARLSILNRHPTLDWDASDIAFTGMDVAKVTVHEMYSDDLVAVNSWEEPEKVVPEVKEYSGDEWAKRKHTVKKHSWQFVVVEGE